MFNIQDIDIAVLRWVQGWHTEFLDAVASMVSNRLVLWGIFAAVGVVAALVWLVRYQKREKQPLGTRPGKNACLRILACILLIGISAGITEGVTAMSKKSFGRLRPHQSTPAVRYMDGDEWRVTPPDMMPPQKRGSSMMSGHASNTMAVATSIAIQIPALSPCIFAVPLVTGVSRISLGKHFPSDILAGWLTGWVIAVVVTRKGLKYINLLLRIE